MKHHVVVCLAPAHLRVACQPSAGRTSAGPPPYAHVRQIGVIIGTGDFSVQAEMPYPYNALLSVSVTPPLVTSDIYSPVSLATQPKSLRRYES
jgi:hypothetical protein